MTAESQGVSFGAILSDAEPVPYSRGEVPPFADTGFNRVVGTVNHSMVAVRVCTPQTGQDDNFRPFEAGGGRVTYRLLQKGECPMVTLEAIDRENGERLLLSFRFSGDLEDARRIAESSNLEVISITRV